MAVCLPQVLSLVVLLLLLLYVCGYINDIAKGIHSQIKLFTNDCLISDLRKL